jgi:cell division protein FtsW
MKRSENIISGDKVLWGTLSLMALFSFLPIFSSSSNLVYVIGTGTPLGYLFKHFIILSIGFLLMISVHKIPYTYFKGISILMMPLTILLLIYTASQGTLIDGANASRWLKIPLIGLSFQTSSLAIVVLMVYVANYFSKIHIKKLKFKDSIIPLWTPVSFILLLILPSNFSTVIIIFISVMLLAFLAGYPLKYLSIIITFSLIVLVFFILIAKSYPELIPNRIDTWISRIENFSSSTESGSESYQVERAKIAISTGEIFGLGAGKSVMKNFLPQSSSDFIYAIIVEEYGLIGGAFVIILYLLLLFRILVVSYKAKSFFGKLITMSVGLPIIIQAFLNIGVAVNIFPVTGQTLPLISSGGTSVWMTCISFGIILSVSSFYLNDEKNKVNIKKINIQNNK